MGAGLPKEVPAYTINKRCGSSVKAAALAAQAIRAGDADVVLAGGVESTTHVPFVNPGARWGNRFGHAQFLDLIYKDGYEDPLSGQLMGVTAENLAERYNLSREEQDAYALESQEKAVGAMNGGRFAEEIVPIETRGRKGEVALFDRDETPRDSMSMEKLGRLKPVFDKNGSVTPGNSCCQADAASALVLASGEKADALGCAAHRHPARLCLHGRGAPVHGAGARHRHPPGARSRRAGAGGHGLDRGLNEAFAAQVIACERELAWDRKKLNVHGGAIALGHPVGATGGKIMATCLSALRQRGEQFGVVSACIGGGQGVAVVLERVS